MFALSSKTRDEIPVHESTQFFPREIIQLVVSFLPTDIATLQQLELTCGSFYSALQPFWESFWRVQYPTITLTKNYRFASIQLHQFIQDYATPGNGTLEIKIVVVGEGAVGKSALVLRYVKEEFISRWDPTM
jgi:type II secretory pathway pseudopilin PulG